MRKKIMVSILIVSSLLSIILIFNSVIDKNDNKLTTKYLYDPNSLQTNKNLELNNNNELKNYINGLSLSYGGGNGTKDNPYYIRHLFFKDGKQIILRNIDTHITFSNIYFEIKGSYPCDYNTSIIVENCSNIAFSYITISQSLSFSYENSIKISNSSNIYLNRIDTLLNNLNLNITKSNQISIAYLESIKYLNVDVSNTNNVKLSNINYLYYDIDYANFHYNLSNIDNISIYGVDANVIKMNNVNDYIINKGKIFNHIDLIDTNNGYITSSYLGNKNNTELYNVFINNTFNTVIERNNLYQGAQYFIYGDNLINTTLSSNIYKSKSNYLFNVKTIKNLSLSGQLQSYYYTNFNLFKYDVNYDLTNIQLIDFRYDHEIFIQNINGLSIENSYLNGEVIINHTTIKNIVGNSLSELSICNSSDTNQIKISLNTFKNSLSSIKPQLYIYNGLNILFMRISNNIFQTSEKNIVINLAKNIEIFSNEFYANTGINISKSENIDIKHNKFGNPNQNTLYLMKNGIYIDNFDSFSYNSKNIKIIENSFNQITESYITLGLYTEDCLVYDNHFIHFNLEHLTVINNGSNNKFYHLENEKGNYWSDYKVKYPDATIINNHWSESYLINGSSYAEDWYPMLYNYIFTVSFLNSSIIPYKTTGESQYLEWIIEKKSAEVINYTIIYTNENQTIQTIKPTETIYYGGEHLVSIDITDITNLFPNKIIPIGTHNFTLIVSDKETNFITFVNSEIIIQNILPIIEGLEYVMMPINSISNISFKILDEGVGANPYYTIKRDGRVMIQHAHKSFSHNQLITISSSDIPHNIGKYRFEIIVNDNIDSRMYHFYFTIEVIEAYNNDAPIITKIPNISYKENSIGNFIEIIITDYTSSEAATYELYIEDQLLLQRKWMSGEKNKINVDGLQITNGLTDQTFNCKLIAYDGINVLSQNDNQTEMSSIMEFKIAVYSDYNDPPVINTYNLIKYDLDKTFNNSILFEWIITDTISHYTSYKILINNELVEYKQFRIGNPIKYDLDLVNLPEGTYTITIIASDGLGKETTQVHTIILTKSLPTWALTSIILISVIVLIGIIYVIVKKIKKNKIESISII